MVNPTELIVEWLESDPAVRDEMGELETFSDLHALQEFLENRIRKESDLRRLRDDLVKYGTQYAPRDIGDLKGFLDWSLAQVAWQTVNHFITDRNAGDPAAAMDSQAAS
ncbi:MAG: hypothetical protein ACYDAR_07275 [Thermomicrobiales bacterium]